MKVYIVQGDHFNVPGRPTSVHSTEAAANAKALELVNIIRQALGLPVAKGDWLSGKIEIGIALERRGYDPDDADVWIDTHEVQE